MSKFLAYIYIVICSFLFITSHLKAQVNDAGIWTGIEIEKKITQAFSIKYIQETRFNENITEAGSLINELGADYRFDKKSRISFVYRVNYQRQLNNMYIPVNRFYFDYSYRNKLSIFEINFRLRAQMQSKNSFVYDSDGNTKSAIRPKISLKYPLKKLQPYLSAEVYLPIFYNEYKPLDKLRFAIGTEYSFNKQNSIDLRYMIQKEFYTNNPVTDFVFSLSYNFKF